MRILVAKLTCLSILFVFSTAQADSKEPDSFEQNLLAHFDRANQLYLDGEYQNAVSSYRKVVEAGIVHPDLFFNQANAYYRSGSIGLAVLFYEKTLQMDPSDEAAKSNLAIVRKELIDRVVMTEEGTVGEPMWHGFIRGLSIGWLTWTFFIFYLLAFAVMIGRRLTISQSLNRLLFWVNIPLLSLSLVFGALLASRIYIQEKIHHGVIVSATTALREGPERVAKVLMEVHAGLKVRLLNEVGDYTRVRLANGVEGFVASQQVGRI
ncbi:MAG: hypothetical protein JRJ19_10675 [Deltaproteobacteria bacterium]|nr:hypothetical protein [Deltaproteobacteria bacterium]MBW1872522.1 hypothetical protein [Deltaproteobacteria bacterium]